MWTVGGRGDGVSVGSRRREGNIDMIKIHCMHAEDFLRNKYKKGLN